MSTPQPTSRRNRKVSLSPDMLETRQLLTGGAGNTFAIMQATVTAPNQKVVVPFTISSQLFTTPKNKIVLGIDVAKNTGSSIQPKVIAIQDLTTHKTIPVQRTRYTAAVSKVTPTPGNMATAVLATLHLNPKQATHNYAVVITGSGGTTGALLAGFYLPGDTAGGGVDSTSDINTTKSLNGTPASAANYSFPADANRDGIINAADLKLTQQNFGVVVQVSPVVSANLSPTTDTTYPSRTTAFRTVLFNGQATPNATVTYTEASGKTQPVSAMADSKGNYSINVTLGDGSNTFNITSTDAFGQTIKGSISPVTYDANAKPNLNADGTPVSSTDKPATPTT